MNNRELQKESLDEIGRELLKSTRPNKEELESLLANPRLFDSVKARIRAEEKLQQPTGFFSRWTNSALLNYRKAIPAFAILIVFISIVAAFVFRNQDLPQIAEQKTETQILSEQPPIENSSTISEVKKDKPAKNKKLIRADKVALKNEKPKLPDARQKRNVIKPSPDLKKQSPEVFYSLGTGENWEKTGEDLQIVRTEISRSELFALGMKISVENEAAKIKTDLLVNQDGIARAIRFVE